MSNNKVIVVLGATGAQGGGLVRSIMSDPGVDLRPGHSQETSIPTRQKNWPGWAPRLYP